MNQTSQREQHVESAALLTLDELYVLAKAVEVDGIEAAAEVELLISAGLGGSAGDAAEPEVLLVAVVALAVGFGTDDAEPDELVSGELLPVGTPAFSHGLGGAGLDAVDDIVAVCAVQAARC